MFTISLLILMFASMGVSANAGVTYPNQETQVSFAQKFFNAQAQGDTARQNFVNSTFQHGSKAEQEMWRNLDQGLTPDGSKKLSNTKKNRLMQDYANQQNQPGGFMGDPKDPGPQDWSDTLIETDGAGNVTGFKPRDWYERDTDGDGEVSAEEQEAWDNQEQVKNMDKDGDGQASPEEIEEAEKEMDKDGDGEVSDEERQEWNDKQTDKRKNGPGSPGNVPPIADWDKNQDGYPDKGFKRSCWQCCPGKKDLNECQSGWPGNCDNGGSCDISEMCVYAPEIHDGKEYECHFCEYLEEWPDPCAPYGLYSSASCNSACDPIDSCYAVYIDQSDGTRRTSTATKKDLVCYECGASVQPPECEDGLLDGSCIGNDCEGYDVCRTVGEYCHVCESPPVECMDGYTEGTCSDTTCQSNQECVQSGPCYLCKDKPEEKKENPCESSEMFSGACPGSCAEDEQCEQQSIAGAICHQCYEIEEEESVCQDGLKEGACPGDCHGEICVPAGENCHTCREKYTCADQGLLTFDGCRSCLKSGGKCAAFGGRDDDGEPCYRCDKDEQNTCTDGYMLGACNAYVCSSEETCHQANMGGRECHACQPKDGRCSPGMDWGSCANDPCLQSQICVMSSKEQNCYYCQASITDPNACEDRELLTGGCPGNCSADEECHKRNMDGFKCHQCEEKEDVPQCDEGYTPGICGFADHCGFGSYCEQGANYCHRCVPIDQTPPECVIGFPGVCDGHSCNSDEECFQIDNNCYNCVKGCQEPLFDASGCDGCHASGGKCFPMMPLVSDAGYAPQCFRCDYPESCEKYGQFTTCSECYEDEMCVPGKTINTVSPVNGRATEFRCVQCMRPTRVEITYYVYIIETPVDYVVLDKKLEKLKELAGKSMDISSVMQLATAQAPGMDKVKNMLGSMGMDPLGVLGGGMSLDQLSGLLQEGLEDRRNRFSEDCFEDNFEDKELDLPQQPPQDAMDEDLKKDRAKEARKLAKKGKTVEYEGVPPREQGQWGQDPDDVLTPDAPAIACGEVDGEKALMVMDSSGNPVAKIFKETLESDPNAITNAIQKAQSISDQVMVIHQGGFKGIVHQLRQKAISMAKAKVKDMVLSKKEEPSEFNPNDQFYKASKKKSKKLLGIFGSSKPKVGNLLSGGGLRMGGKSPEDKRFDVPDQWGIQRVGYLPMDDPNSAWNIYDGSAKNVVVAVIDSGFDFAHKDGPQYVWTNPGETSDNGVDDDDNGFIDDVHGWNFIDHNNDLTDRRGHGTHVAGIIAAQRNNKRGIAGINPGAVIMPIKVADEEGETDSLKVYQAIHYAVNNGAQIINISIGGRGNSKMVRQALQYARTMGVFVAVASGNTGEYLGDVSPAKEPTVLTVSAIDHDGEWSTISSVGPNNGVLAPGEQIMSLRSADSFHKRAVKNEIDRQYFRQSGTSFSTPIVTGTASLMLAKNPNLTPSQIADILLLTAKDMGDEGWDGQHGAGLLDATKALSKTGPEGLVMQITDVRKTYGKRDRIEYVDVFATVRGDLNNFMVKLGKGEHTKRFEPVTEPFTKEADNDWVTRIPRELLRGSDEWILMLSGTDTNGKEYTARMFLEL